MVTLLGELHSLYASGNWIVFHYSVARVYRETLQCGKRLQSSKVHYSGVPV
jgi:hypothetical protein